MQRETEARKWSCEEVEGKGITGCTDPSPPSLASSQPPPLLPFSPFLSQETPSGLDWKPDLSSSVCMLRWDVLCSLSCSLHSPFYSQTQIHTPPPHVFDCLSLPLFFSWTLTPSFCFFISHCLHPMVPSGPLGGQWCNHLLISHHDWQIALLSWGVATEGQPVTAGQLLDVLLRQSKRELDGFWKRNRCTDVLCVYQTPEGLQRPVR